VELISSDAVQVELGQPVIIEDWGGSAPLDGEVIRIDPFGVTKVSALGVEEQRVPITVELTSPTGDRRGLGHGYRVEARIVIWAAEDVIRVPASALFRVGERWAVFAERDDRAVQEEVKIGRANGVTAEVLEGLDPGDRVVLYPSAAVTDGISISRRVIE
jgi:HlyD family secretion protein